MDDLAKLEAITAIWVAGKRGHKETLLAYLRSQKPLTLDDRNYLADYLEGKLSRKRGRPRGGERAQNLANVAHLVQVYKAKMRKMGKRYRIHDKAVEWSLMRHELLGYPVPSRETLENYLRRSKRRKK